MLNKKTFYNVTVKMSVEGFRVNSKFNDKGQQIPDGTVQLNGSIKKPIIDKVTQQPIGEFKFVKTTLKIHKAITEGELKTFVGKNIEATDCEEIFIKESMGDFSFYKKYYSADNFKSIGNTQDEIFEVERSLEVNVANVFTKGENFAIQSKILVDNSLVVQDFTIKNPEGYKLKELVNKTVLIKPLTVTKMAQGTYYSSTELPTLIGAKPAPKQEEK